jgi:hypothetical protein
MDKLYVVIFVIIAGAMLNAAWPGFFPAVGWLIVLAVSAGLGTFCIKRLYGLRSAKAEARRQRQELAALHGKVVLEHERIWEEEHEFDRAVTGR